MRAVPFDVDSLEVDGNPVPVVENVLIRPSGTAAYSVSSQGRLVYVSRETAFHGGNAPQVKVAARDRIAALVDPAINALQRALKHQNINAAVFATCG